MKETAEGQTKFWTNAAAYLVTVVSSAPHARSAELALRVKMPKQVLAPEDMSPNKSEQQEKYATSPTYP